MTEAFRIVHITDTHLWADPDTVYRGWRTNRSLLAVVEHIRAQGPQPDAVLLTGDLAHDEKPRTYRRLRDIIATLEAPVWALPGNHDHPAAFQQHLAPACYLSHVDIPGWRVILLNSHLPGRIGGRLQESELARLTQLLEDCQTPCLVALHHPAWQVHSAWLDVIGLENGPQLMELLMKSEQVRAVVCGHIHQQWDRRLGHLQLLATPSTCRQFLPGSTEFAEDAQPPGYRWLILRPNGAFETRIERVPQARSCGLIKEAFS